MQRFLVLFVLLGINLASPAHAGELSAFKIVQPREGAICLVDGEIWFVPSPVNSESANAMFHTARHESGSLQIWKGDRGPYLTIDSDSKDFRLWTQPKPTSIWKWTKIGARGDTKICHLEITEGNYKGQFLGIEDEVLEIRPKQGGKSKTVRKLKLVEKQDEALRFNVYPLAP